MNTVQAVSNKTDITAVQDIINTWPRPQSPCESLPLVIVCNDSNMQQHTFLQFIQGFLNGVVIEMCDKVEQLLSAARERNLPVLLDVPRASAKEIPKIKEAASSFAQLSLLFSGDNKVPEEGFDLVFYYGWRMCNGDMSLVAALLVEKMKLGTNFTSHLELTTLQTARVLLKRGENPSSRLELHPTLQPLFTKLAANCQNLCQLHFPNLVDALRREGFLMGCLLQCFEKRSDRILSLYSESNVNDMYNKLTQERLGAEFGVDELMQEAKKVVSLKDQCWWPFDDNRPAFDGESDHLLASFLSPAFTATVNPNQSTMSFFWKFIFEEKPGSIISLSHHGYLFDVQWKKEGFSTAGSAVPQGNVSALNGREVNSTEFCRKMEITCKSDQNEQKIPHLYHFAWQDGGVVPPEQLYYLIQEAEAAGGGPLVHCQAGLGRTGTFLAAYQVYLQFKEHKGNKSDFQPDILGIVLLMNMQRWGMVQTRDQFASIFTFLNYLRSKE
jgi:Protein-tyrosine phosphatase